MDFDDDPDTCSKCGVELGAPRVIVLQGSLVIMFCTECGKNEPNTISRSGTHSLDLEVKRRSGSR